MNILVQIYLLNKDYFFEIGLEILKLLLNDEEIKIHTEASESIGEIKFLILSDEISSCKYFLPKKLNHNFSTWISNHPSKVQIFDVLTERYSHNLPLSYKVIAAKYPSCGQVCLELASKQLLCDDEKSILAMKKNSADLNLKANNLFIDSELLYEKGKSIKTNGGSFFDSSNLNIKEPISYPNRDVKLLKMSKKFRICQQAIKKISLLNSNSTVLILANDNTIYYSSIEKILSSSATSPFTPYPQFSSEGHENVDFIENLILDAKHDSLWFFDAEKQFEHVQTVDLSKEAMNGYSYSSSTDKNVFFI